jgi:hypothetical protein
VREPIDANTMSFGDLRYECKKRRLSLAGAASVRNKHVLVARLQPVLDREAAEANVKEEQEAEAGAKAEAEAEAREEAEAKGEPAEAAMEEVMEEEEETAEAAEERATALATAKRHMAQLVAAVEAPEGPTPPNLVAHVGEVSDL